MNSVLKRCLTLVVALLIVIVFQARLSAANCIVNAATSYQSIDGIGFSSAWCGQLSTAKNDALYNTLGMSLLRCRIDPNRSWSQEAANSSAAHARGAKVMGTAWTPPASKKSNNNIVGGNLNTSQYGAYATFLRDAANTINLDWVSFQNEPDITVTYESCTWDPTQMLNFVKNNSSTIGRSIIMPESFNFKDTYSDPTLNDSAAASRIAVVGGHIYGGGLYTHQNALNKGKRVWQTEHYRSDTQTNMANCIGIAKEIQDCMNAQMHAYFWWWVSDGDSSVNLVNTAGTIFKNGYTIGQVIVAVNTTNSTVWQTFSLQNISGVSSLIVHRTTSSLNMSNVGTATVSNNSFGMSLPPQSVSTAHQY
jgi:glucuronoarabinoxylan endo-1,4-beta-xylanase